MNLPHLSWLEIGGIAAAATVVGGVYLNHRDPNSKLDLLDLIMSDGRLDLVKTMGTGGFLILCYVIVALLEHDRLTEGYLTIFVGTCVAPLIVEIIKRTTAPRSPQ